MEPFDPSKLSISQETVSHPYTVDKGTLPKKRYKNFLKGPIPMNWINKAGSLPGKALHIGIILWHLAGMEKSLTVKLSTKKQREMGIKRTTGYTALKKLEEAGLVSVKRRTGRNSVVTLIEVS